MLDALTADHFATLIDTEFRLFPEADAEAALPFRLTAVDRLASSGTGARPEPFSLIFDGPDQPLLAQRIYHLEHDAMPALDIFLVPVARAGNRVRYQAIFN
jgi:hypothetical protein